MAKIEYPDKSKGDQFFGTEATEIKDVVNENVDLTEPSTWYVHSAPKGDNANVGSANFPFETLQAAIDVAASDDIIIIQSFTYINDETIIIDNKRLTFKGPVINNRANNVYLRGDWTISGVSRGLVFENVAATLDLTISSGVCSIDANNTLVWFGAITGRVVELNMIGCDFRPVNASQFSNIRITNSVTVSATDDISLGKGCVIENSVIDGNIITGLDGPGNVTLKNSTIGGDATITGDLNKLNSVVVGTETVSGTTTSRQAKVFDDNVLFKGQVTVSGVTISFTATPTFDLDDGNVQEMILTSNVTSLTLSNKLDAGNYLIYLIQDGTGGHTLPTPDSSWGTETDNSVDPANFLTGANDRNLINVAVSPSGFAEYSIETHNI